MNDYDGDATKIKDLARNTIIVPPDKLDSAVAELAKRGANVTVIDGAKYPLGYSGVNSTIKTQAGIVGEIQVNTPAMIYAKESEPQWQEPYLGMIYILPLHLNLECLVVKAINFMKNGEC